MNATTALTRVDRLGDATEFLQLFSRLCVALRESQDDTGITQEVYWEALRDVPLAALEAGARALMRESGRKWFPTTAEWRTAAGVAQTEHLRTAVTPSRPSPGAVECDDCRDTGWRTGLTCPGDATCGRTSAHRSHEFAVPCRCRLTNGTYRRHIALGGAA